MIKLRVVYRMRYGRRMSGLSVMSFCVIETISEAKAKLLLYIMYVSVLNAAKEEAHYMAS